MFADMVIGFVMLLGVLWFSLLTPFACRRASQSMGRDEFMMLFSRIRLIMLMLAAPSGVIFGLVSWRTYVLLADLGTGGVVLWLIINLLGIVLLLLHTLMNAIYYTAVIDLGYGYDQHR